MSSPNCLSAARPPHSARPLPRIGAMALAFALALPAVAGELYQWKDANGVTHYSDSPPPAGADYENRTIHDSGAATMAGGSAESQCTTARANLAKLQGDDPVGADADRDGKPDAEFTAEQRAAQTRLAEAAIQVHCSPGAEVAAARTP